MDGAGVAVGADSALGVRALATLIRDSKLGQLPNLMQRGRGIARAATTARDPAAQPTPYVC